MIKFYFVYVKTNTPKYKDSFFNKMWKSAKKNESKFKPINVLWKENPYLDEGWYKKHCLMLRNPDAIATELDGKFIAKKSNKKAAINIRLELEKKEKILERMKQKKYKLHNGLHHGAYK